MSFTPHPSDPFYDLMKPPEDETQAQKTARLEREAEEQRRSNAIDEQIKEDSARIRREKVEMKVAIKVLLLGPESATSTLLKNLRIQYAYAGWITERNGWDTIIRLHVVRSINIILKVVRAGIHNSGLESDNTEAIPDEEYIRFTDRHQQLLIRLAPLSIVESLLKRDLAGFVDSSSSNSSLVATLFGAPEEDNLQDDGSWTDSLEREALSATDPTSIAIYKEDMKALWNDPVVRLALRNHQHQIGNIASFFLNEIDRVANWNYTATDDDILKARLRTNVQEYDITLGQGMTCRIFHLGGNRTSRSVWLPYFENVDAIIFLAPVSILNEGLEDQGVNRLEDYFALWKEICSSRLLARSRIHLFLTECDLSPQKLEQGIKINKYIPSYGDRSNDMTNFVEYLKDCFLRITRNPPAISFCGCIRKDVPSTSMVSTFIQEARFQAIMQEAEIV